METECSGRRYAVTLLNPSLKLFAEMRTNTKNLNSRLKGLTHLDPEGNVKMVDVSNKPVQHRQALARGQIHLQKPTLKLIQSQAIAKGNVLATARLAGIMAAKKTGELIPLCHPLQLSHCEVQFEIPKTQDRIVISASATIGAQTGVEMEALTAVSVAALTIYDMCKAVDKTMRITDISLVFKVKR
jgi:cyclic pyranopterin phosphate synthase